MNGSSEHWFRWQLNAGLVFACLDYNAIVKMIHGSAPPEVRVEVHTQTNRTEESWANGKPAKTPAALEGGSKAAFTRMQRWPMYGRGWGLFFQTTAIFDQYSTRYRALWAGGAGLAATGLFCWALAVQTRERLREMRRAAELKEARDALQATHNERERMGHDLHDGAIQSLYAIQLALTRTGREVEAIAPETAGKLAEARASLDAVIGELREFIGGIKRDHERRPVAGLGAVLESLVRRLRAASPATIELRCDPEASERLTSAQALQLAAIAREALSNSLRHARSKRIEVQLTTSNSHVVLEVTDEGSGFDPARPTAGMGLTSMRRRAEDSGGTLDVEAAPAKGTRIRVAVPMASKHEQDPDADE